MRHQKLLLIGIILLASILRLYSLGSAPVSLFGDEVDAGYNAFSLLKTGKDYNGNPWPIYSESLGDFRPTAYMYTLIPGIVLFGLNNFSVRIIPALLGIINIYLIYLLIKQAISLVKKNQLPFIIRFNFPLLTALLLTITPWHIHFSRVAIEQTLYLTLLLLGTYAILKTLHHPNWGIIAGCFFALATYTYHAAKLFSPLLFFTLILVYRQPLFKLPKKQLLLGGLTFVLILVPLISDFFYGSGQNRFNKKPVKFASFLEFYDIGDKGIYEESGFAVMFLVDKFGKGKLLELIKSLRTIFTKEDFYKTFKDIYGFEPSYESFNK